MDSWESVVIQPLSIKNYRPDDWSNWFNRFNFLLKTTRFSSLSDSEKVSVLLMKLGYEINPIFNEFGVDVSSITYDDLVEHFNLYFQPLKARNVLINLKQKSGESFEQFAERLTIHSYPCTFGPDPIREIYLCDVFLNNLEDVYSNVRAKIIKSYRNIKFREVVRLADQLFMEECGITCDVANGFSSTSNSFFENKMSDDDFRNLNHKNNRLQNSGQKTLSTPSVSSFHLEPIKRNAVIDVHVLIQHSDFSFVYPLIYEKTREAFFKFFNETQREHLTSIEVKKLYAYRMENVWYRVYVAFICDTNTAGVESIDFGWRKNVSSSELHYLALDCVCQPYMALKVKFDSDTLLKSGEKVALRFLNLEDRFWTVRLVENYSNSANKQQLHAKPSNDNRSARSSEKEELKGNGRQNNRREHGGRNNCVSDDQKTKMQNDGQRQKNAGFDNGNNNRRGHGRRSGGNNVDHDRNDRGSGRNNHSGGGRNDYKDRDSEVSSTTESTSETGNAKCGGMNRRSGGGKDPKSDSRVTENDSDLSSQRTSGGGNQREFNGERGGNYNRRSGDVKGNDTGSDASCQRRSGGGRNDSGRFNQRSGGGRDEPKVPNNDIKVPDSGAKDDESRKLQKRSDPGKDEKDDKISSRSDDDKNSKNSNDSRRSQPPGDIQERLNERNCGVNNRRSADARDQGEGEGRNDKRNSKSPRPNQVYKPKSLTSSDESIPDITKLRLEDPPIPKDRFTEVVVLNVINQLAYVCPESCNGLFQKMNEDLQNISKPLKDPKPGMTCVAPYEGDSYRAQILKINGDSAKVLFVDFGNEEVLPLQQLYVMPKKYPRLSFPIKGIDLSGLSVCDSIEVKLRYIENGICIVEMRGGSAAQIPVGSPHVEDSRSPSQQLRGGEERSSSGRSSKTAQPVDLTSVRAPRPPIPKNTFTEVRVGHVGEEGMFVFSLDHTQILSKIHETLNSPNSECLPDCTLVINKICAAPFEGEIFRAKILSIDRNKSLCRVEFIDFGNQSNVQISDLLELPDDLIKGVYVFKIRFDRDAEARAYGDIISISPIVLESDGTWLVQLEGEPLNADYQLPSGSGESVDEKDDFIGFSKSSSRTN